MKRIRVDVVKDDTLESKIALINRLAVRNLFYIKQQAKFTTSSGGMWNSEGAQVQELSPRENN